MANIIMQHTKMNGPTIEDNFIWDDDTVTDARTGDPKPNAVVTHNDDGSISVDISGNGMQDVQPYPDLGRVQITRQVGWQGNLGWKADLLGWDEETIDPGVYALAVYHNPDGENYYFTTGAFVWDANAIHPETGEAGMWGAVCPAGFEPGQVDVHFGMLYASINFSTFTLRDYIDEEAFITGGTPPAVAAYKQALPAGSTMKSTEAPAGSVVTWDDDYVYIDLDGNGYPEYTIDRNPDQQGNNGI
jgi:hypothetical protein